ncbi:transglycosylase SLT domain-containing protein [Thermomicrobium sp. 4228-Ro]|uniref:transglycosylase SLT domain-containing protein n=1 Tax=Thermomicrobium sp. 4228-Ro TaxID=2993937 RepID=UPI0022488752|nr:transglycosylase SLT domain-containing protein [Thermomicrobium sp. 4228-Ro]MCX2727068.1 transglycosylase SLT domain-containing protein [Thermomicrobium sp. 4228-Ro]
MTTQPRMLFHSTLVVLTLLTTLVLGTRTLPVQPANGPTPPSRESSSDRTAATPTPRPVPADPIAALEQAQRLLAAGVPAEAARILAPALGAREPTVRMQARLLLARAMLPSGDPHATLELAAEVARRAPDQQQAGEAAAITAQALLQLGEVDQAIEQLQVARTLLPEIAPYLEYRALDALVRAGRHDEAQRLVDHIVTTAPIRRLAVAALEWQREQAQQHGDDAALRATLDRLLELATIPTYRATLLLQRAQVARTLGDVVATRTDLLAAIETAPESAAAAAALDELDALGAGDTVPLDRRAAIAFASGRYPAAIAAYSTVLESDPSRADAWYQRAIARIRSGDLQTGIDELLAMAERYPRDERTPDALVTAGTLVEWHDEPAAEAVYERVLTQYPASGAAREARFRLGLLAFGRGDAAGAARIWRVLADSGDARATFWYGKALAAAGDRAAAQRAWERARTLDPEGFYGIRAGELLAGREPVAFISAGDMTLTPDTGAYEHWLATLGLTATDRAARLMANDPVRRALLLLDLGDREAASWEVDAARDTLRNDPVTLALFGWELLRRGEAAFAYRIGLQLQANSDVPTEVVAPLVAPVPYPEVLATVAAQFRIDPLLVAALVRQESAFEPTAVSPAGARGLTQVLPETGAGLATQLGLSTWNPDQLFQPETSLTLGAAELARRLEQFGGQLYLALASYNAGVGAVQEWLRERPASDPDLFAERIPYRETYAYVQRVYAGYRAYQQLYGAR